MSAEFLAAVGGIPDRAVGLVAHAARDVRVECPVLTFDPALAPSRAGPPR
jgi:hypothetical protein